MLGQGAGIRATTATLSSVLAEREKNFTDNSFNIIKASREEKKGKSNSNENQLPPAEKENMSFVTTSSTLYVKSLLSALVESHVGDHIATPATDSKGKRLENTPAQVKSLMEYSMRILSSRLTSSSLVSQDYLQLTEEIKKWVVEENGMEMAVRISAILGKLSGLQNKASGDAVDATPEIRNLWSIIYFLWMLKNSPRNSGDGISSATWTASVSEPPSFLEDFKKPSLFPSKKDASSRTVSALAYNNGVKEESSSNFAAASSIKPHVSSNENISYFDLYKNISQGYQFVSEDDLVKDVLFILQGVNGSYLKFEISGSNGCKISCKGKVTKSCKILLIKLAECGFHYRQVTNFLRDSMKRKTLGLYKQSFCFAIQEEISQYDKFIACLESYLVGQHGANGGGLTLIRLYAWLQDQMKKMGFIWHLISASLDAKGGELLSLLHHYSKHGDPLMQKFMEPIFKATSKAFYLMMTQWMQQGILEDPFDEFFIASTGASRNKDKKSTGKGESSNSFASHVINSKKIPSFIPRDLAHKVYRTGKSLNFLRSALCDTAWLLDLVGKKKSFSVDHDFDLITKNVEEEYGIISSRLVKLLYEDHMLLKHLEAIKKFLLLGQGDFILSLLDHLKPSLDKPANSLFRHNLTGILETSIRSSAAQFESEEIIKRLDVRLMEASASDKGWDVFSLEYVIDSPLDAIIDDSATVNYLRLFQYLWKIRRIGYEVVHSNWKGLFERKFILWTREKLGKSKDPETMAAKRSSLGQYIRIGEVIHFLNQLQYFMVFEVLECSWKEFVDKMNGQDNDIDSIRELHQKYIADLMSRSLLNDEKIYPRLMDLLDDILKFSELAANCVARMELSLASPLNQLDDEFAQSQWSIVSAKLRQFLSSLQQGSASNVNVRLLSFRLNFNQFY